MERKQKGIRRTSLSACRMGIDEYKVKGEVTIQREAQYPSPAGEGASPQQFTDFPIR